MMTFQCANDETTWNAAFVEADMLADESEAWSRESELSEWCSTIGEITTRASLSSYSSEANADVAAKYTSVAQHSENVFASEERMPCLGHEEMSRLMLEAFFCPLSHRRRSD